MMIFCKYWPMPFTKNLSSYGGTATCMSDMINAFKILVRKPEAKRPHKTPRHRWKDKK
jgi:hypothetical protein